MAVRSWPGAPAPVCLRTFSKTGKLSWAVPLGKKTSLSIGDSTGFGGATEAVGSGVS